MSVVQRAKRKRGRPSGRDTLTKDEKIAKAIGLNPDPDFLKRDKDKEERERKQRLKNHKIALKRYRDLGY